MEDIDKKQPKVANSLLFKILFIFALFTIITIGFSGVNTYVTQMHLYKSQCLDNLRNIVDYLELLIKDSGDEFIDYQEYYMQHYKEIDIPYDFTEYRSAHHDFQALVMQADKVDLSDSPKLGFSGLSEEEKKSLFYLLPRILDFGF